MLQITCGRRCDLCQTLRVYLSRLLNHPIIQQLTVQPLSQSCRNRKYEPWNFPDELPLQLGTYATLTRESRIDRITHVSIPRRHDIPKIDHGGDENTAPISLVALALGTFGLMNTAHGSQPIICTRRQMISNVFTE